MKTILRRNRHNLSHFKLGTCFPGELVPVCTAEVLPGDTFNHKASAFLRLLPQNAPLMQNADVRIHHFFVPNRIIWSGWEDFITRKEGASAPPTATLSSFHSSDANRLADYLGINMSGGFGSSIEVSKLPFAAVNAIYNEWYRDQDLQAALVQDADALNIATDCKVRNCAWPKDNFTASRPWPQKGADVTIPLGTEAPLVFPGNPVNTAYPFVDTIRNTSDDALSNITRTGTDVTAGTSGSGSQYLHPNFANDTPFADLSGATAATVTVVKRAFKLQELAERLAQFGSRYPELLASMGVKSSDARLQRPEYLGGGKFKISFSEVLQTAEGATTPVGEMRGHGMAPGSIRPYRRFFEEHGYVISFMSVRPQAIYSQLIPRHFFKGQVDGANDYYTPELESIGQQEIYNKEIYQANDGQNDDVFGFGNRYQENRKIESQVCGDLHVGNNLDVWTWARGFASRPALNETFIKCVPSSRIFEDEVSPPIIFGVNNSLIAQRMLTKSTVSKI